MSLNSLAVALSLGTALRLSTAGQRGEENRLARRLPTDYGVAKNIYYVPPLPSRPQEAMDLD